MSVVTTGALSKLDSQLAALYLGQSSMAADATAFTSMVQQFAGSISGNGQYVVIDATAADGNGSSLLGDLQQIGEVVLVRVRARQGHREPHARRRHPHARNADPHLLQQ